ncbi:MAG: LapA family protein [Proteobacteria bacterium]|nr:LapA family protein [Pseudomonadota bacterium]MBU1610302.1 LapA family protein [Pseudomonadota bacterium]
MRYVKLILLVLGLGLAALFFIQNQILLLSSLDLKLDLYLVKFLLRDIPFYGVVVGAFVIGIVLCLFFLIIDKIQNSSQLRTCRKRLRSLEEEVISLRNLPLQDKDMTNSGLDADVMNDDETIGA